MNFARNKQYFVPPIMRMVMRIVGGAILGIILGMILYQVTDSESAGWVVGLLVFIGAVVWAVMKYKNARPTDEEIDAQAESLCQEMRGKALEKLGVDEEQINIAPALEFWNYSFEPEFNADQEVGACLHIRGKDGCWRTCVVELHGIYFSEGGVHHYEKKVSLVSNSTKDTTDEYFYKDIVSVETETKAEKVKIVPFGAGLLGKILRRLRKAKDQVATANNEYFAIANSGGGRFGCSMRHPERFEAAVNAMRALLREKKA